MDSPKGQLVDWYIVFRESESQHWWNRFMKPGWQHCYAVRWDGFEWILFEPNLAFFEVRVLPVLSSEALEQVLLGHTAVHIRVGRQYRMRAPWVFTPFTCVEACKALLGIRKFWLFTPWQLFKYLRKTYCVEPESAPAVERIEGTGATAIGGASPAGNHRDTETQSISPFPYWPSLPYFWQ